LLCRGTLSLTAAQKGTEVVLTSLNAGSYIGETSLVKKMPRTANVKTVTNCVLLQLAETDFSKFLAQSPETRDTLLELVKVRAGVRRGVRAGQLLEPSLRRASWSWLLRNDAVPRACSCSC
jgi:CRP-like cAMP-binding protein